MAIAVENCGLHNRVALRIIMMVSKHKTIMALRIIMVVGKIMKIMALRIIMMVSNHIQSWHS